jgi:hypothetical protein
MVMVMPFPVSNDSIEATLPARQPTHRRSPQVIVAARSGAQHRRGRGVHDLCQPPGTWPQLLMTRIDLLPLGVGHLIATGLALRFAAVNPFKG